MSDLFNVRSVLLCDEVREEVGGKQLIIGAYAGVTLLQFVPFFVSKITLRFEINVSRSHFDHVECTILRPNGSIFTHEIKPSFDARFPNFPTSIVFVLSGLNFEYVGNYAVLLAMDGAPERVGDFTIVTPDMIPQNV